MNKWTSILSIIVLSSCLNVVAASDQPETPPLIFLDAISVGEYDVDFNVPKNFKQISQHVNTRGQVTSFIPQNQNPENPQQRLTISIDFLTGKTAKQRIEEINKYFSSTYENDWHKT
mgnify:CR=1 FL=1